MSQLTVNAYVRDSFAVYAAMVYDLYESIAASKYPMQVKPDMFNDEMTDTVVKLAQSEPGSGHDNWLMGIRVAFDIKMTAKMLVEAERYHFWDIVSLNYGRLAG